MVADFFYLEGFNATFVGTRTPASTIHKAIEVVEPDYLVISVTNFYNFASIKKTIEGAHLTPLMSTFIVIW